MQPCFNGPLYHGKMVNLPLWPSGVSSELCVISKQSTEAPTEELFGFSTANVSIFL